MIKLRKQTMIDQIRNQAESSKMWPKLRHIYLEIENHGEGDYEMVWGQTPLYENYKNLGKHSFPCVDHLATEEEKLAYIIDWLRTDENAPDIELVDWI